MSVSFDSSCGQLKRDIISLHFFRVYVSPRTLYCVTLFVCLRSRTNFLMNLSLGTKGSF